MQNRIENSRLLELILKPIIRLLVRRSVSFREFDNRARQYFIEAAIEELNKTTLKVNTSRISVVTGLQRKEVNKFLENQHDTPKKEELQISLPARIVALWEHDRRFLTKDGTPRVLRAFGEQSEFAKLCGSVSQAINPGTILFELQRNGLVEITPRGAKLLKAVAGTLHDENKAFELLGKDLTLLLEASEQNIVRSNAIPNLHTRTEYDNVYIDKIDEIRTWIINEGRLFHKKMRDYISKHDKDITPAKKQNRPAGAKIAITAVSMIEMPPAHNDGNC